MKKAVESKCNTKFKGRDLRVKRATPVERRDKKELKKRQRKDQYKEARKDSKKHRHGKGPADEEDDVAEKKESKSIQSFVDASKKTF